MIHILNFSVGKVSTVVILSVDTNNNYLILLSLLSPQRRSPSSHYYALFSSVTKIDSVTFSLPPSCLLSDSCLSTLAIHVSIPEIGKIFIWETYWSKKRWFFFLIQFNYVSSLTSISYISCNNFNITTCNNFCNNSTLICVIILFDWLYQPAF